MIFYLHYMLLTSGLSGASVLLGTFFKTYTDASDVEIAMMLTSFPFISIVMRPLICSLADRHQAHKIYLIAMLVIMLLGFTPFLVVPFFPKFYRKPRLAWYLLLVSGEIGQAGLNVVWSLGDSLANNMAQKTGVPFSRMRLVGTLSWGVYGSLIGQINELPSFPKFVPAFFVFCGSIIIEIVLLILWKNEDFMMVDGLPDPPDTVDPKGDQARISVDNAAVYTIEKFSDTRPIIKQRGSKEPNKGGDSRLQILLFKLIIKHDAKLIGYLTLYTMIGILLSPMNFIFLSIDKNSVKKGYNFSRIAGSVLLSQALSETLSFLVAPWLLSRFSRSNLIASCLVLLCLRYFFYSTYYYEPGVSPYWASASEWAHGLSYGVFATILADLSHSFADRARLFTPELRNRGIISPKVAGTRLETRREEFRVATLLRSSMQGTFGGVMDGLGAGIGSSICGIFADTLTYRELWHVFMLICVFTIIIHQLAALLGAGRGDADNDSAT